MLLDRIRSETRALHEALERRGPMARLIAPDLTRAEYGALVSRLHAFYVPLEARLAPHAHALPVPFAPRAPRLRADLQALGLPAPGSATPVLAAPGPALPSIPDARAALGSLYVIEGAALGGRVIARHVARSLGLTPGTGLAFFTGDAEHTGARWMRVRDALAALPDDADRVAAAAFATFTALHDWVLLDDE